MATLTQLVDLLQQTLKPWLFQDYCPNGLQVGGREEVRRVVTGVTACQALIDEAVRLHADAVLVHHGFFWKNENPCITGMKKARLKTLLAHDLSLLAYHCRWTGTPIWATTRNWRSGWRYRCRGCCFRTSPTAHREAETAKAHRG